MANENRLKVMVKKLGYALGYYFQMRDNANVNDLQIKLYKQALKKTDGDNNANANEVQLQNFSQMKECADCVRRAKRKGCECK